MTTYESPISLMNLLHVATMLMDVALIGYTGTL
jgi:hypothetical protein